ncbi:MAG: AAA family ATPase [Kiritimatiellae bacterium]|nr:AAA family ATPase [Kiritimatiellia bacterium]
MRPIATDTADFPKLREKGCIYVDKTMFMHRMASDVGTNLFFISRPRPVWLVGLSFDSKTRHLVDFAAERAFAG